MSAERRRRRAARVLLVDADGCVLLLHGSDPARPEAGTWWLIPGGGVEDGESVTAAAVRELAEETGLVLAPEALGDPVLTDKAEFDFDGVGYEQTNLIFRVRVKRFEIDTTGWTQVEVASLRGYRWWSAQELRATAEAVHPAGVADLIPPN